MELLPGLRLAEMTVGGRAYLLSDGLTSVLVDTGAPDGTLGAGQCIESAGRKPHEVRLILLTHGHRCHAGNVAGLRLLTGATVAASAETARLLAEPAPPAHGLGRLLGGGPRWPEEPVRVDRILEPGELIDLAGGIEVLEAPGHAPGNLAFRLHGPDALCSGDALGVDRRGRPVPPPRRACSDAARSRATATGLAAMHVRVLAPGHGWPLVDGRLPVKRRG